MFDVCAETNCEQTSTLILDNVPVVREYVCRYWHSPLCSTGQHVFEFSSPWTEGHEYTRAPAAITHFVVDLWNNSCSLLPVRVRGRKWAGRKEGSRSSSLWLQVVTLNLDLQPRPPSVWQYALWQNTDVQTRQCCLQNGSVKPLNSWSF